MTNSEFATALRNMAQFYDDNPEAPQPFPRMHVFEHSREEFLRSATAMAKGGKVRKWADDPDRLSPEYHATRDFGGIEVGLFGKECGVS